jgi:superoxide dismutase, Cu-Zn family
MHRSGTVFAGLLLVGSFAAGDAQAQAQSANAPLVNAEGEEIGNVALTQMEQGVRIDVQAEGVPAGTHAFHIHETGDCQTPDFQSAGGHYNPTDHQHGWNNPEGPHAGDLPNVQVQDDGVLAIEYFTDAVTLGEGDTTVFDDDGSAIVMHEGADDYETDPAGDAGSRIACGVIEAAQ